MGSSDAQRSKEVSKNAPPPLVIEDTTMVPIRYSDTFCFCGNRASCGANDCLPLADLADAEAL